jgi:methyltransferase (TIGR00027 family)
LDSFTYRRTDLAKIVRVFELDHPATQAWKRGRLQNLGIEIPVNLSLVPVDFEKQSLNDSLRQSGHSIYAPGFFSWLGVVPYLTSDAIFDTLRTVAALAPGTEIIFEYVVPRKMFDEEGQKLFDLMMVATAGHGEPWRSFFEPDKLARKCVNSGLLVSDFGPDDVQARYFAGRNDGLRPLASNHYMRARVGARSS